MAHCPKCGVKLRITDWKPICPKCGTNLNYYRSNERLMEDAERAEIEHYYFQPKIDRLIASFVGSGLAVLRIVLTLLPAAALFLPLVTVNGNGVNILKIFDYVTKQMDVGAVLGGIFKGELFGVSLILFLLSVVLIPVTLILITMALGKHGKIRNTVLNSVQLGFAVLAAVSFPFTGGSLTGASAPGIGIGAYLYAALILAELILTVMIYKKGIRVKYKTCLIGGLPGEKYFEYVNAGVSREQLNRYMLKALGELEEKRLKEGGAEDDE